MCRLHLSPPLLRRENGRQLDALALKSEFAYHQNLGLVSSSGSGALYHMYGEN